MKTVTLRIAKTDWDEFMVQWVEKGKVIELRSYFTTDKKDAEDTRMAMKKRIENSGHKVKIINGRFLYLVTDTEED